MQLLRFEPVFKEIIWGGSDILKFKGLPADGRKIGESWELSHVENNFSIVAEGKLKGKNIDELIREYGSQLLGDKVIKRFGQTFPLLIKFIDARDNLSIQVHPDDDLARLRHNSAGKTEMWYVINATPAARLYDGFSKKISPDEYVQLVENDRLMDVLKCYNVKAGDVFFLPAGRVHAIGAGCFIAEIQQTSNITYRIYDYNRKDAAGNPRELHTELAKDAIDYTFLPDYQTHYEAKNNTASNIVECQYFTTNILRINQKTQRDFSTLDSFIIYICTRGKALITDEKCNEIAVKQGQTILIPASAKKISILPEGDCTLLETSALANSLV